MTAYYNEHDEFAADWLRNLIKAGLIADGEVDTRSIVDVRAGDLLGFTQHHFFAGIGGWSYALRRAGWPDDHHVWTGSCPCQPFSLAGSQKGFADERHLWPVWRELIRECGPTIVFGEQVASATDWLGLVRSDLEAMEYAVGALPIQAASAGADHLRDRYWFVAHADSVCGQVDQNPGGCADGSGAGPIAGFGGACNGDLSDAQRIGVRSERPCASVGASSGVQGAHEQRERIWSDAGTVCDLRSGNVEHAARLGSGSGLREGDQIGHGDGPAGASGSFEWVIGADGKARRIKPGIRLLAHGVPNRVGLLRGFGNAIDHRPAAAFIEAYMSASKLVTSHHQVSEE